MSQCGCERGVFACSESHAKILVALCGDCLYPMNECEHGRELKI